MRKGETSLPEHQHPLNDLDVLAFLPDGRSLLITGKTGNAESKTKTVERLLQRAHAFPADLALLLFDTEHDLASVHQ
jgi:hypothetical protein